MLIVLGLFRWWYNEGFMGQLLAARQRLATTADYFSIVLLLKTLFSPFRQISAGNARGPLGVQVRAWVDRMVSRFVGATIRSLTIIAGVVALVFSVLFGCMRLLGWLLLPALPLVGLVLALVGWVP